VKRQLGQIIARELDERLKEYRALRGTGLVHFLWDDEIVLTVTYDTGTITVYDRCPEKEKLLKIAKEVLNTNGFNYEEKQWDFNDPRISHTALKVR
jgi:hypothetical protein